MDNPVELGNWAHLVIYADRDHRKTKESIVRKFKKFGFIDIYIISVEFYPNLYILLLSENKFGLELDEMERYFYRSNVFYHQPFKKGVELAKQLPLRLLPKRTDIVQP